MTLAEGRWPPTLLDAEVMPFTHQWGYDSGSIYADRVVPFDRARAIWSGNNVVRPAWRATRIRSDLLYEILRVGLVAAAITVTTNLTVALTTGIVGRAGSAAIAGYGVGSRLEYLLIPLAFSLGAPLVAMVGTCIGAGRQARALRAAWLGAAIAGAVAECVGLAAALYPASWMSLFSADPVVIASGSQYLRIVGPFYGFFGAGMVLYFLIAGRGPHDVAAGSGIVASHGWPARAGGSRSILTQDIGAVFAALALALVVFGTVMGGALKLGAWGAAPPEAPRVAACVMARRLAVCWRCSSTSFKGDFRMAALQAGTAAPDFTLASQAGEKITLAVSRAAAPWCRFCPLHSPAGERIKSAGSVRTTPNSKRSTSKSCRSARIRCRA